MTWEGHDKKGNVVLPEEENQFGRRPTLEKARQQMDQRSKDLRRFCINCHQGFSLARYFGPPALPTEPRTDVGPFCDRCFRIICLNRKGDDVVTPNVESRRLYRSLSQEVMDECRRVHEIVWQCRVKKTRATELTGMMTSIREAEDSIVAGDTEQMMTMLHRLREWRADADR